MQQQKTECFCDKCGREIALRSRVDIVTSLSDEKWVNAWSRLHIRIIHSHGVHNSGKDEQADLCQRVKAGERVSKGIESTEQEGWGSPSNV